MTRILLARHGQTAWNALGKIQGHVDVELDETGFRHARELGHRLVGAGIEAAWSSDLGRARQTAEVVAEVLKLPAPRTDPELRERHLGVFQGLTRDECAARYPEAWQARQPPDGETRADATVRMARVLTRIATTTTGTVVVISHGLVMRLWLASHGIVADDAHVDHGETYDIDFDGTRFVVEALNE